MTLCSYRVACDDILDLTDAAGRHAAGITRDDLGCAWERLAADRKPVPTWNLADRLTGAGCAGILVPSFASRAAERDTNLVFWRWGRTLPHQVVVVDDAGRLPHDRSSWD